MRNKFNSELVQDIRVLQLQKIMNEAGTLTSFDKDGNVIRDHKKEAALYAKDEEVTVLTDIELGLFDSYNSYKDFLEKRKNYKPDVDVAHFPTPLTVELKRSFRKIDFRLFYLECPAHVEFKNPKRITKRISMLMRSVVNMLA